MISIILCATCLLSHPIRSIIFFHFLPLLLLKCYLLLFKKSLNIKVELKSLLRCLQLTKTLLSYLRTHTCTNCPSSRILMLASWQHCTYLTSSSPARPSSVSWIISTLPSTELGKYLCIFKITRALLRLTLSASFL